MTRRLWTVVGAAAFGLGLAACGSTTPATTTTTTAPATTASSAASTATAGLTVESSTYGSILANAQGHTLYAFSTDSPTKVTCTGTCATIWIPFTLTAVPSIGKGVTQSLLGDVVLPDGSHQLTYGGHPLYTFVHDTAAHQTHGEGLKTFGGVWSVVSASTGKPVTAAKG